MSFEIKQTNEGIILQRYNPYNPSETLSEHIIHPSGQAMFQIRIRNNLMDEILSLEKQLALSKQDEETLTNLLYSKIKDYYHYFPIEAKK